MRLETFTNFKDLTQLPQRSLSLYGYYHGMFEGVVADTHELIEECFRLRYKVYCEEHEGYENKETCPNFSEHDEYDNHALHALLRHRLSRTFIGTVRLILKRPGVETDRLPLTKICATNGFSFPPNFFSGIACEISRFSVSKELCRRIRHGRYAAFYNKEELARDRARLIPCMSLGLIIIIFKLTRSQDIQGCCAAMKPSLLRLLSKLGIHFIPLGHLIEYHGQRQVCYVFRDEVFRTVAQENPDLMPILTEQDPSCN